MVDFPKPDTYSPIFGVKICKNWMHDWQATPHVYPQEEMIICCIHSWNLENHSGISRIRLCYLSTSWNQIFISIFYTGIVTYLYPDETSTTISNLPLELTLPSLVINIDLARNSSYIFLHSNHENVLEPRKHERYTPLVQLGHVYTRRNNVCIKLRELNQYMNNNSLTTLCCCNTQHPKAISPRR